MSKGPFETAAQLLSADNRKPTETAAKWADPLLSAEPTRRALTAGQRSGGGGEFQSEFRSQDFASAELRFLSASVCGVLLIVLRDYLENAI